MKKLLPILLIIVLVGAVFGSTYNKLNNLDVDVDKSWAQVENTLQRRADLIPNLVETVKAYAGHEEEVLTKITNARSSISKAQTPKEYAEANEEVSDAIRGINVVVEAYPELKANENFQNLQAELAGSENRITVERQRYNEAVGEFNKQVRRFPTNLVAGLLGFHQRDYFEISQGASEVPKVEF